MIELPPPPATVDEAMRQANQLAYGFAKHTDPAYWTQGVGYLGDPPYYWKRLLGWQAGGVDVARFGIWAVPPSPWNVPVVIVPPPPAPPVPLEPTPQSEVLAALTLARLNQIETRLAAINELTATVFQQTVALAGVLLEIHETQARGLTGTLFGYRITLTPPKATP